MKILVVYTILLAIVSVSGCAAQNYNDSLALSEIERLPQENYSYDFSKGANKGELIIISQPASMQLIIKYHNFNINGQHIRVYKNSITRITLDAGDYVVKGWVTAFGIWKSHRVNIQPGESTKIIFRGPLDLFATGIFWDAN